MPCEGHDFGTFRDATIVLFSQTTTEGSIWVVEEGPNHLGWRVLVDDRGLQLRSCRKSDIISGTTGKKDQKAELKKNQIRRRYPPQTSISPPDPSYHTPGARREITEVET